MLACEKRMETETAINVQRIIERATEAACPCKVGKPCPVFVLPPRVRPSRARTSPPTAATARADG